MERGKNNTKKKKKKERVCVCEEQIRENKKGKHDKYHLLQTSMKVFLNHNFY